MADYTDNIRKRLIAQLPKFDAAVRRANHESFSLGQWENLSTPELEARHDKLLVWGWKQVIARPGGYQVEVVVYLNGLDEQGVKAEVYIDGEYCDSSIVGFIRATIIDYIDEYIEENMEEHM